jgi:hypothetical protein
VTGRPDDLLPRDRLHGRPVLSFPARQDGPGRQWSHVRPISDEVRRDVERQVCERVHIKQEPAP